MLMKLPTYEAIDDHVPALTAPPTHVRPKADRRWLRLIGAWIERSRQRRALADLDDRLLGDIGVTRAEAAAEIATPFWR